MPLCVAGGLVGRLPALEMVPVAPELVPVLPLLLLWLV